MSDCLACSYHRFFHSVLKLLEVKNRSSACLSVCFLFGIGFLKEDAEVGGREGASFFFLQEDQSL